MPDSFDLVVIGAGSGGVAASRRAAAHGARVAIVESSRVGGTCVIRGCVPKKLLMYAAAYGDAFREAAGYGWSVGHPHFEMPRWAAKAPRRSAWSTSTASCWPDRRSSGSRAAPPSTARSACVGDRVPGAAHLVATGAAPVGDSIPGIEACPTSDDLLDLHVLPQKAAIIGGGFIALEFASMLARLGVDVSLFYRAGLPLRGFDEDLRTRVAAALEAAGVKLHPGVTPRELQRAGGEWLLISADERMREYPFVLNATGRRPNTAGLGLERLGIQLDAAGAVPVDARLHTTAPGVYAIGDVTHKWNLTPVAIAEGRALADSLFGPSPREVDLSLVTAAVFTLPPLATVGPTEAELLAAGRKLKVFEADFRPMRQAFIDGAERCYMKLLVDASTDKVLAVHMLGADAPEIVQSLAVALSAGATKAQFDRTIAVHPTAAEEFVLMREPSRVVG